jgi:hypothetical protein
LIIRSYIVLLKDSILLYGILSRIIVYLLDQFGEMSKKEAVQFVNIYKLFVKETNAIIKIYDGARSISSNLPTIEPIEESMIAKLEECVQGIANDGPDNNNVLVEDAPEELLGTKGGVLAFNSGSYTSTGKGKNEKSDSSESSSAGDNDDNTDQNDFFNFLLVQPKIQNTPKTFNMNHGNGQSGSSNNSNGSVQTPDPFALFSGNGNNNKNFNPFEPKSNNTGQQVDFFSNTKEQNNNSNFNPFLDNDTSTNVNTNTTSFNPFEQFTTNNTTNTNNSGNPFL